MRLSITFSCGLWLASACTTPAVAPPPVKPAVVVKPKVEAAPAAPPVAPGPPECPVRSTVCTMEYNPAVCSAASYDGKAQAPAEQLIAWGPNGCAAKLNLLRLACSRHLLPSKMGGTQCVPDASDGHCPPADAACAVGGNGTTCVADTYGTQHLSPSQAIKAAGSSECEAKASLAKEACRRNLDPQKLVMACKDQGGKAKRPAPAAPASSPAPTSAHGVAK